MSFYSVAKSVSIVENFALITLLEIRIYNFGLDVGSWIDLGGEVKERCLGARA